MKKKLIALFVLIFGMSQSAFATPTASDLSGLGMEPTLADKVAQLGLLYITNNSWLQIKNAAGNADVDILRLDGSDNLEINVGSGKVINLSVAKTPEAIVSNDRIRFTGNQGVVAAPTGVAISAGAADTPNHFLSNTGLRFGSSGMGLTFPSYVPTMAATPAAGTNDLKIGLNVVPTAAANTSACLPASPSDGDTVVVVNANANAVRPKSCSTPGVNGGAAGTYLSLAAWSRAVLQYNAAATTWLAGTEVVPTPAGP